MTATPWTTSTATDYFKEYDALIAQGNRPKTVHMSFATYKSLWINDEQEENFSDKLIGRKLSEGVYAIAWGVEVYIDDDLIEPKWIFNRSKPNELN
jgi:hypothetical protein